MKTAFELLRESACNCAIQTALHLAAESGADVPLMELLIECGADVMATSVTGLTAAEVC